jgi:putative FmdB family regulatory protein
MPIYEFACRDCGTHFEEMQSFSATTLPPCPACGSHHVGRLLSRPAIHFKGSGWYVTDSRNASKGAALRGAPAKAGEGAEGGEPAKTADTAPKETAKAPAAES